MFKKRVKAPAASTASAEARKHGTRALQGKPHGQYAGPSNAQATGASNDATGANPGPDSENPADMQRAASVAKKP